MHTKHLTNYIEQYHHNDPEAMENIIQKMSPLLWKYANKFPYCDREDAFQEFSMTLMECVQNIADYSVEEKCLAYLKKAIINKYIFLKEQRPKENFVDDDIKLQISTDKTSSDDINVTELMIFLQTFVKKLSPRKQIIFKKLLDGFSCLEIARELQVSRQYVHAARQDFQKELQKQLMLPGNFHSQEKKYTNKYHSRKKEHFNYE